MSKVLEVDIEVILVAIWDKTPVTEFHDLSAHELKWSSPGFASLTGLARILS